MAYYTYILLCSDNSFYVGHTHDLDVRTHRHRIGQGAYHTPARGVAELLYPEKHSTEQAAIKRERQIKWWSRGKKLALIRGDASALRQLSKSRD